MGGEIIKWAAARLSKKRTSKNMNYSRMILVPTLKVLILTVLCFSVCYSGQAGNGDKLVLLEKRAADGFSGLDTGSYAPCFNGNGWMLAALLDEDVSALDPLKVQVTVLADDAWARPYLFIFDSENALGPALPRSLTVLARVPEGVIVSGGHKELEQLVDLGFRGMRIPETELPLVETGKWGAGTPSVFDPGLISSFVDQVSDSTITEYINRLEAFRTRYSCTDSLERAAEWIHDKFLEFGFTEVYYDTFYFGPLECDSMRSVIAVKEGSIAPDKYVVVGGHYDSFTYVGPGCDPDTLAPGADDDASGTVATLEAARILANVDTDVTLIFVAWGGEEYWMWGSGSWVAKAYQDSLDIKVAFNMDMIGNVADSYWDIDLHATEPSLPYAELVADMGVTYTDLIPVIYTGTHPGDALPFWEYGFRAVSAEESDFSPNYHSCDDVVANISIPYLTQVTEMFTASILRVSRMPDTPVGFNAVNVGDGTSLYLDWEPNQELDIEGYNIYFGTQPDVYDSVKTVPSAGDTLYNLADGTTLYLALSAIDTDGYESFLTAEISVYVSSTPSTPTGLTAISFETAVVLQWDRNIGELDIAGYNIYREVVGAPRTQDLLGYVSDPITAFPDNTADPHVMYSYFVTAVDTQIPPNESDPSSEVRGRLSTHDMGILIIDNTRDGAGAPFMPTDEEVDTFYDAVLSGYNVTAHWDVSDSTTVQRAIMNYDVGMYSTVVWHSDVRLGSPMAADTTAMRMFLETGGNLWLSGWMLMESLSGESGPNYIFGSGDFISEFVGVDSARITSNGQTDFIGARGMEPGFPSVGINLSKVPLGGLFSMDVLLEPFGGSYELYTYVSSDSVGSQEHGKAVGLASSSSAYGLVLTGFPLFFLETGSADALAGAVMDMFEEAVGTGEDEVTRVPLSYALSQNYPNPFNPITTIRYEIPEHEENGKAGEKVLTILSIFDVRGRQVKVLVEEELEPGSYQVTWDGKNAEGVGVSSGIYFYRIYSGSFSFTRKMLLVK